ncbi:MAG: RNA methyltransferase [Actinobacteria bacterium]|nr:RNA methyltransferase [Actinomycetota bacterium]
MIESLNSPHVGRVKALISSRGAKERSQTGSFIAEGIQCIKEALQSRTGPQLQTIYITNSALDKFADVINQATCEILSISDDVARAMSDTVTPQGIIAVCTIPRPELPIISSSSMKKFVYLSEIQDPGNAGTIIRSADAFGFDAVLISPNSVDIYSPKVVRSTVGSLWHIPVYQGISLKEIVSWNCQFIALDASADLPISKVRADRSIVAIFGNEARGLNTEQDISDSKNSIIFVKIPMPGNAESLNLSAAASIVMYQLANIPTS